jgi:hypothetical protein
MWIVSRMKFPVLVMLAVGLDTCLAAPVNDLRVNAAPISTGHRLAASLFESTVEADEPIPPPYNAATWQNSVWFAWTAPAQGGWHQVETTAVSAAVWRQGDGGAMEPIHALRTLPSGKLLSFTSVAAARYLIALSSEEPGYSYHPVYLKITPAPAPPVTVSALTIFPRTVDSATEARDVRVTVTLLHGALPPYSVLPVLLPPASRRPVFDPEPIFAGWEPETLATGAGLSTFTKWIRLPFGATPGIWQGGAAALSAGFGGQLDFGPGLTFPVPGAVDTLTVVNSGVPDTTPPELISAVVSRRLFNPSVEPSASGLLTLTFRDPAGIAPFPYDGIRFIDPATKGAMELEDWTEERLGQDLILKASFSPQAYQGPGAYPLEITVADTLGNTLHTRSTAPAFPGTFIGTVEVTGPPRAGISDVVFSPGPIDVTTVEATVTASFRLRGANALSTGLITLSDRAGHEFPSLFSVNSRAGGSVEDHLQTVTFVIPPGAMPGPWRMEASPPELYQFVDGNGNPAPPPASLQVVNHGNPDVAIPLLTAVSLPPAILDLTTNNNPVVFSLSCALADPAGVMPPQASFLDPRDPPGSYNGITLQQLDPFPDADLHLTGGTLTQGTWTAHGMLPDDNLPSGRYPIRLRLADRLGNASQAETSDLNAPGAGSTFLTVINFAEPSFTATFLPATVDVSNGPASVEVFVEVTAPGGGSFVTGFLNNRGPHPGESLHGTLNFERISGTAHAGRWRATTSILRGAVPGLLPLHVSISQKGPDLNLSEADTALTIVNTGPVDVLPPVLTSLLINPSPVDLRQGRQQITVTVEAADDLSGIETNSQVSGPGIHMTLSDENRISGSRTHGIWRQTFFMDPTGGSGTGPVALYLADPMGNSKQYNSTTADFPGPFRGEFAILNVAAPELLELSLTPSTVDVTSSDQTVHIAFRAKVAGGFDNAYCYQPNPDWLNLGYGMSTKDNTFSRTSGTETEGRWEGDIVIPRGTPAGSLSFRHVIFGQSGPGKTFDAGDFIWENPATALRKFILTVVNQGTTDTTAPQIDSFTSTPGKAPGFSGNGWLDCLLEVSDNLAGVDAITGPDFGRATLITTAGVPRWTLRARVHAGENEIALTTIDRLGNHTLTHRTVTVPPVPQAYRAWLRDHGLPDSTPPLADSDSDGIPDLLECAFGTSPASNSGFNQQRYQAAAPDAATGSAIEPARFYGLPRILRNGQGRLEAGWWQPVAPNLLGMNYIPEISVDLEHWTPVQSPPLKIDPGSLNGRVWTTVEDDGPAAAAAKWMRVRVELLPGAR